MAHFTYHHIGDNKTMEIVLNNGFSVDDQEELLGLIQERTPKGITYWDLNLTELAMINSLTIGMLVSINGILSSRGGDLRLLLLRESKVTSMLKLVQLDKILRFVYISTAHRDERQ